LSNISNYECASETPKGLRFAFSKERRISLLKAAAITKAFKNPVLKGVSIKTEPAKIIGLAGENGSGKSTLLAILAGIMPPDSGNPVFRSKHHEKLGGKEGRSREKWCKYALFLFGQGIDKEK
jgi:ABC-type polysaccharide/polyol phosphate transport system ATPase subunit